MKNCAPTYTPLVMRNMKNLTYFTITHVSNSSVQIWIFGLEKKKTYFKKDVEKIRISRISRKK